MASISNLVLDIDIDVANAEITVDYDISFSSFDVNSNLTYLETCRIVEKDPPPEDGTDDAVTGMITGFLPFALVASNGVNSLHRTRTRTIPKAQLDRDAGIDEIRAVVTLTPQLPTAATRESNLITGEFA